jgi:RND superfamily putative drug exporter
VSMSTSGQTDLKILATGLGAGILVDAVVVRCLLVPAMVALFGRANWWLPAWAARLLRLPAAEVAGPAVTGAELTPVSSSVAVPTPW